MLRTLFSSFLIGLGLITRLAHAQTVELIPEPVLPLPSAEQIRWHQMEMNAFIHFSLTTYTAGEWGYGDESPDLFNPSHFDSRQWMEVLCEAGFKGVILTAKHHDGFCLWPTAYSDHSIKKSPWMNGKGDVVGAFVKACREAGLKPGIYLSPWDRNHAEYGRPAYLDYYRNQLEELISQYGPFFEIWIDGANGGEGYYGGARETRWIDRKSYYNWPSVIEYVRHINPEALIFSDAGPDIRWVGNERGEAAETNWNLLAPDTLYPGKAGIESLLQTGSETGNRWIPAECDVSIRPGWFYHSAEDSLVESPEELFAIYLRSVGRGGVMLLNIPPGPDGRIHDQDIKALRGFRKILDSVFQHNLAPEAVINASNTRLNSGLFGPGHLADEQFDTWWATDDGVIKAELEFRFRQPLSPHFIVLQEYIALGQRIKSFSIQALVNKKWSDLYKGTTVGYKRIVALPPVTSDRFRLVIVDARACPILSEVGIY
ncbi:MAG: alpha-L-fucosidase [Bacteroidales bacterium]